MRVVQLRAAWTYLSVPAARGPLTTARLPTVNPLGAPRRYTSPILSPAPPAKAIRPTVPSPCFACCRCPASWVMSVMRKKRGVQAGVPDVLARYRRKSTAIKSKSRQRS